jgi:chromosomal replication initiator protein
MTYKELSIKYTKATEIAFVQEQYIAKLEELIRDKDTSKDRLNLPDIMSAVCNYYQVESRHLFGIKRNRPYVRPRQIVCYIAKYNIPDITLKEIGRYLGNRDHSTVIHSVRSVEDEMSYNKRFETEINEIKGMLNL